LLGAYSKTSPKKTTTIATYLLTLLLLPPPLLLVQLVTAELLNEPAMPGCPRPGDGSVSECMQLQGDV
jgi:hypothetical protein